MGQAGSCKRIGARSVARYIGHSALIPLALAGCSSHQSGTPSSDFGDRIVGADKEPENWLSHGRGYDEARFSPLAQIDKGNVGTLGLAWFHDLDTHRGQEATPLVVDGVIYTTSAWSKVQAFDAPTGRRLWQ